MGTYGQGRAFDQDFDINSKPHEVGDRLSFVAEFQGGGVFISDYQADRMAGEITTTGDVHLNDGRSASGITLTFDCNVNGSDARLLVRLRDFLPLEQKHSNYGPGRRD